MASVWQRARISAWLIVGGLGAQVLDDLVLDRQAVAVPAGHVRAVEPGHRQRADDDVLEHLVEQGAHVDLAVGVGRAVVQDLARPAGARLADLAVEVLLAPPGLDLRLADRQVRLHVEPGDREIERLFVGLGMTKNAKPYKETLNLPATRFDMKANLPVREPQIQARWHEQGLYEQVRKPAPAGHARSCMTAPRTPTARSTWAPCSTRCSRTSWFDR